MSITEVAVVPTATNPEYQYAAILDAGSSGTRLYIYQWIQWAGAATCFTGAPCRKGKDFCTTESLCNGPPCTKEHCHGNALPPTIKEIYNWKKKGGLAKVEISKVADYLEELFDRARLFLGRGVDRTTTPLFLLGTAGMRDLDDEQRDKIIKVINRYIGKSGFMHADKDQCGNISGENEALYGWLAVNYLHGNFTAAAENKSQGYVEMGGASAQIALRLTKQEVKWIDNHGERKWFDGELTHVRICGSDYYVYAESYNIGAEKAWRHHQAALLTQIKSVVHDPCLPSGCSYSKDEKTIKGTLTIAETMSNQIALVLKDHVGLDIAKVIAQRETSKFTKPITELTRKNFLPGVGTENINDVAAIAEDIGPDIAREISNAKEVREAIEKSLRVDTTIAPTLPVWKLRKNTWEMNQVKQAMIATMDDVINKSVNESAFLKYRRCEDATFELLCYLLEKPHSRPLDLLKNGPRIRYHAGREFFGGSQFYYTTREIFGVTPEGRAVQQTKYNYTKFLEEVLELSEEPWDNWKRKKENVDVDFLQKALFMASWITQVLVAFGFPLDKHPLTLQPYNGPEDLSGCELTWTLGRIMLHSINCTPMRVKASSIRDDQLPNMEEIPSSISRDRL